MPVNQELYDECANVFYDVEGQEVNILNLYLVLMKARHGAILEVGYKGTSNYIEDLFSKEFKTNFSSRRDEESVRLALRENSRSPWFNRLYDLCSKHNLFVINRLNKVLVTHEKNKELQKLYILEPYESSYRGFNALAQMLGYAQLSEEEYEKFSQTPQEEGRRWREIGVHLSDQKIEHIAFFSYYEKKQLKGTMSPRKIAEVSLLVCKLEKKFTFKRFKS